MRAVAAALVVAAAAASTVRADVSAPAARVVLKATDGVVIHPDECLGRKDAFFTPSPAEVGRLEALLPAAIAAVAEKDPKSFRREMAKHLLSHLATDRRYYTGVVADKERHVIEVEGRCRIFGGAARCPPEVDDGGDCVWHIRFDVKRGTFDQFATNGVG